MRKVYAAATLALVALVLLPATALAHVGAATVSCTGANFTWVDFGAGSNTVNYRIDVDSTPAVQGTFVLNAAGGTEGQLTVPMTLYGTHRVQAYSWWGPAGVVNGESRPASSPPLADKMVYCAAAPPAPITAPVPPAPVGSSSTSNAPPPPSIVVAGERVTSPQVHVSAQKSCAARHARITVKAAQMRQVRLWVTGHRPRTMTVAAGARRVTALVPLRRHGPAVQKVTAHITFRNGAPARTLVAAARRCSRAAVLPSFTG